MTLDNLKEGERRFVTMLFSDMKGSTALSERMDPEEIDQLMNTVFGSFEQIIKQKGGMVEKFIGDALVAVFGVPDIHEDDPSRAIHSALEFIESMKTLNADLKKRGFDISFRTGIHTGLITTGKRGEYDVVTGHAMNVAQRLEAESPPDSILVSEATKEKCENDFFFSKKLTLTLKGKKEALTAYEVLGHASGEMRDSNPFFGRKPILDEVLKSYIKNSYHEVSGFFLSGDPGIGKTRTVLAFIEKLRKFPDFSTPILTARSQKYKSYAFSTIIEIILEYFELDPRTAAEASAELAATLPGISKETAAKFSRIVSGISEGIDDTYILVLYSIFNAILQKHVNDVFPILVFIDNANTMDKQSREFFQYLFKNGKIKPFFILTGRDFTSGIRETFAGIKNIKLGSLTEEESLLYIKALLPDFENHTKLIKTIIDSSMGNPLFLREYVKFAKENKDASSLPLTIQNIFLTALDRYPEEKRNLLKKLSVYQISFSVEDAKYIEEKTDADPQKAAETLEFFRKEGLLTKDRDYYFFALDVHRKALYNSLLNFNKKIIHSLIADRLLLQNNVNFMRLIYHLMRSERYLEAVDAMQKDHNRNYHYEYEPYIDNILKHLKKTDYEATIRLLITKSAILFNSGKIQEAETVLSLIIRTAVTQKNSACMGFAYHQICAYNAISYAFQKASFTAQKALYYYRKTKNQQRGIQNVLRICAINELFRNRQSECLKLLDEMAKVPAQDKYDLNEALCEYYLYSGDYNKAILIISENLGNLTSDNPIQLFFSYDLTMRIQWQLCDFTNIQTTILALTKTGQLSDTIQSQAYAMLGAARKMSDTKTNSDDAFRQAEFACDSIKNDYERIDALRTLALSHYIAGNKTEAEKYALDGLVVGTRHSSYYPTFTLLTILTELAIEKNLEEDARFFLKEASYLFSTDPLLHVKDRIVYYYWSAKLNNDCDTEENLSLAKKLLEEEKDKLKKESLIANLLSTRTFARIHKELFE